MGIWNLFTLLKPLGTAVFGHFSEFKKNLFTPFDLGIGFISYFEIFSRLEISYDRPI